MEILIDSSTVVKALAALAHASRLDVYRALVVAGSDGLTPGQLGERFSLAGATLSFHLKELHHAGLIRQQRQGRHLYYSADFEQMASVLAYLTANCCGGQACEATAYFESNKDICS